ncbi:MAG: glycosyltransferase family 2 protein [Anaerolineae bacterium]
MELAVVILNWNAAADTIRCGRALSSWSRVRPTIWVVDNGSIDGSAEEIARECPFVHLIRNSVNLGFAGGNNRGIQEALAQGGQPILLLNNDAHIDEDSVLLLLETLYSDPRIGFVGPLLFDADQTDRLLAAGGRNPVLHHHSHILCLKPGPPIREVDYVVGTVALVRSQVFHQIGLLDEAYFFSTEIADLCMRARRRGYLSVVDTRARAYHALHRSSHLRETLHTYYIIRNRFLFISKFYSGPLKLLLRGFWTMYSLALGGKLVLSGKSHGAQAVWLGLVDGLYGRFGGQNERVFSALTQFKDQLRR